MARPEFWQDQAQAAQQGQRYEALKKRLDQWQSLEREVAELQELSVVTGQDASLVAEVEQRITDLEERYAQLEFFVLFSGPYDDHSAVVSIHAGTGGVDAQDWASMLTRLYTRFCERHDLRVAVVDETPGAEAGIKSITLEITGPYAYGWLRSEHGVHRLVRISPFDAEGMRHTSFALVEVLPEIETSLIELTDNDLKIEVFRAGGHGGQSVNTTDSAVRITHLPTGITVKCQNERSQVQNKNTALKILKARLAVYYQEQETQKMRSIRGAHQQAEWGRQARSYVLQPYQLVKDHRSEHETADISRVLDGHIDDFVESYLRHQVSDAHDPQ